MYSYIIELNAKAVYGCKSLRTAERKYDEYAAKYDYIDNSLALWDCSTGDILKTNQDY